MSLNSILYTGVTGLMSHQAALSVTSNNIANVQTEGYARKVVDYGSVVLNGVGSGVEVEDIRRVTDQFIAERLRLAEAETAQYTAMSEIYNQLQSLLGDPAANSSLTGKVDSIHTAFSSLTVNTTLSVSRSSAVNEIQNFGIQTNQYFEEIQKLRAEADGKIAEEIQIVNEAIFRIDKLNVEIISATIGGEPTGELEDQRDQALTAIAAIMDVETYSQNNGSIAVTTNSGLQLLDYEPRQLVYNAAATITAETQFAQITVNSYDTVNMVIDPNGIALDPELTGGSIRGWLNMRNVELPAFADQIGALAGGVAEQYNAIHNANIAVHPPATLTGHNTGVLGTDDHGFTGEATFHTFDAANDIVASVTIDFDNVAFTTIDDVTTAVNAALGAGTLTLTNGAMTMAAPAGSTGVGIEQDPTDPSLRGGKGFSHFFGMNDLIETSVQTNFETGLIGTDTHEFTGTTDFSFTSPDGAEVSNFTIDFGAIGGTMADVLTEMNTGLAPYATATLTSTGAIEITAASGFDTYKLSIENDTSDRGGTGLNFPDTFGLGAEYPSSMAVGFDVRTEIAEDPMMMALARVDAAGTPALSLADNRGALALEAAADATMIFPTIGGLTGSTVSISDYAAQILAQSGLDAARAESLQQDRASLSEALKSSLMSVSGVNMDEEMANLIIFQNAYNASARLITTAREMYDTLLSIV